MGVAEKAGKTGKASVTEKAKKAYGYMKNAKTAKAYFDLAKAALDEDTRSGALFKGGLKITMELAKRVLGTSLTSHPYYALHKTHFDVLEKALNASSAHEDAAAAIARAVGAADATAAVHNMLEGFVHRRNVLLLQWQWNLLELLLIQAQSRGDATGARLKLKDVGMPLESLSSHLDAELFTWRASWSELVQDATELSLMVDAEARAAEEAMARYAQKMAKLEKSGTLGSVAAGALRKDLMYQQLDRMRPGADKGKPLKALLDPAAYARSQSDAVDLLTLRLAHACDIALGDEVTRAPEYVMRRLKGALMMR
jgi:hypothetical protein